MLISIAIFLVVLAIMIYSIFTHRKSKGHQRLISQAQHEVTGDLTLVPFALLALHRFVVMGIPAYHSVHDEDTKTDADMVLKVTGSQWKWQYEYPAEGIKFVSTMTTSKNK